MDERKYYLAGMIAGLLVAGIVLAVRGKKKGGHGKPCEFDERQKMVRGNAFKYGFITMAVYFAVIPYVEIYMESVWVDEIMLHILGICLGLSVFAVNSIWNDAYFSLKENPGKYMLVFAALLCLNLFQGIHNIADGGQRRTLGICNLSLAAFCLLLLGTMGMKRLKDRRTEEME